MAKIKKLIEDNVIHYPATITDAVKNPNNGKTVTEELTELGSKVGLTILLPNKGYFSSIGYLSETDTFSHSDFIKVNENDRIIIRGWSGNDGVSNVSAYNENKKFISPLSVGNDNFKINEEVIIPSGVSYIIVSLANETHIKATKGIARHIPIANSLAQEKDLEDLKTKHGGRIEALESKKCPFIVKLDNVGWIGIDNGLNQSQEFSNSNYIGVSKGDVVYYNAYGGSPEVGCINSYNEEKEYLGALLVGNHSQIETQIEIPENVAYIRVSAGNEKHSNYQKTDIYLVATTDSIYSNADRLESALYKKTVEGKKRDMVVTADADEASKSILLSDIIPASSIIESVTINGEESYVNGRTYIEEPDYIELSAGVVTDRPIRNIRSYIVGVVEIRYSNIWGELEKTREYTYERILDTANEVGLNVFPRTQRLDGNTILSSNSWFPFHNSDVSVIDDHVRIDVAPINGTSHGGIRNNNIQYLTENVRYILKFKARAISNIQNIVLWLSGTLGVEYQLTNEWVEYSHEFVNKKDEISRIQISRKYVIDPIEAESFEVKDFSVAQLTNSVIGEINSLNERVETVENDTQKLLHGVLYGKKISVIGDSISTIGNNNAPYWKVLDIDVNKQIQSYVTWNDVYVDFDGNNPTNKTIGGVALTQDMIGKLITFTPNSSDVGKEIGVALNYNSTQTKVWSQALCEKTNAILLSNASWSGSRITIHGDSKNYELSEAWNDYTIHRCKKRNADGTFETPDVIIIYRGTNDFSHSPYSRIDDVDISNGLDLTTDYIDGKHQFRAGYYLTIKKLREAYPKAIIYCATLNVFKRCVYDKFPTRNGIYTLPQMNDVIRDIANTMGCGVVEFDKDGITFENCYSEGYITDSATIPTHPNSKGHEVMARKAISDITHTL